MTTKTGFNNQWVEIFRAGTHTDSAGRRHELGTDFLEAVVSNYEPVTHEAPAVIGHPREDAPAYGSVSELRINGESLEARFVETDADFEGLVEAGRFKKRSPSFYTDPRTAPGGRAPYLRHVGFLGAQPPAVKGLRPIHFSEGDSLTFEIQSFSEGDTPMDEKEIKSLTERLTEAVKAQFAALFGGKGTETRADFSETDVQARIDSAIQTATASFTEKLTAVEQQNKLLEEQIVRQSGVTTRQQIISFCDGLGAEKCPPAFRNMGLVEFMETLAALPGESKVTVISFSEEAGKRVEAKTESTPLKWFQTFLEGLGPFIQFGERFGNLTDTGTGEDLVDPGRRQKLRAEMGLTAKEGK